MDGACYFDLDRTSGWIVGVPEWALVSCCQNEKDRKEKTVPRMAHSQTSHDRSHCQRYTSTSRGCSYEIFVDLAVLGMGSGLPLIWWFRSVPDTTTCGAENGNTHE